MQYKFLDKVYDNGYLNGTGNDILLFFERCDKLVCKCDLNLKRLLDCIIY